MEENDKRQSNAEQFSALLAPAQDAVLVDSLVLSNSSVKGPFRRIIAAMVFLH